MCLVRNFGAYRGGAMVFFIVVRLHPELEKIATVAGKLGGSV